MAWYDIVLLISSVFFLISTLGSLFFGGVDVDFDWDTDVDAGTLLSDILSFKGLLHFCMGFSLVLTLMRKVSFFSVTCGVITGIVFAVVLYYLYKFLYEKAQQSIRYTTEIKDLDAEVYFWNKNRRIGEVFVTLEGRPVTITIHCPDGIDLENGQKLKVSGTRKLVYPSVYETIII
jgi:prepilin signal peptidase PulO-like enzyme (type II secretory pathway)